MISVWMIYTLASIALVAIISWILYSRPLFKFAGVKTIVFIAMFLLVALLTPMAVPETNELAPAWLATCYEMLLGQKGIAFRGLIPLYWTLGVSLTGLVIICLIWRSKPKI